MWKWGAGGSMRFRELYFPWEGGGGVGAQGGPLAPWPSSE